jgi:hypothetical protein
MTSAILPMIVVLLTFLFVLLIILVAKAPKAAAWVIGGLVLLTPILLYRLGMARALAHKGSLPVFIVPVTFLFVLLVILLAKAPKAALGLLAAILVMGAVGLFVAMPASRRRVAYAPRGEEYAIAQIGQQAERGTGSAVVIPESDRVFDGFVQEPSGLVQRLPSRPRSSASSTPSPIWSEGVEQEFDADEYPSKRAAVRALGSRIDEAIGQAAGDGVAPVFISIFQEGNDRELAAELVSVVQEQFPEAKCGVEAGLRNAEDGEVGITLYLSDLRLEPAEWAGSPRESSSSGRVEATVFGQGGTTSVGRRFVEKPWVVDFASFANSRPGKKYAIARSRQTCTSENDAMEQALADAAVLLTRMIGEEMRGAGPLGSAVQVTSTDVLGGDIIVDRFVQGLFGSASKIWRSALLIDTSGPKLAWLIEGKSRAAHSVRMTWARMIGSAFGVVALIAVIYFFLNMATRGYYEWSLRIAGIVLAIVAVVSVLMVVR